MLSLRNLIASPFGRIRFGRFSLPAWTTLVAVVLLTTGCGHTQFHNRYGVTEVEEWQPEYEAAKTSIISADFGQSFYDSKSGRVTKTLVQEFEVQKILYNQRVKYVRVSKDPNLFFALNPLLLISVCVDKPSSCFGRHGDWSGPYNEGKPEFVKVVDREVRKGPLRHPSASVTASVLVENNNRKWKAELHPDIENGRVVIDLKSTLLQSPFRPKTVMLHSLLKANQKSVSNYHAFTEGATEALGLFSESWLTTPELFGHYMNGIRTCTAASDYKCAVKYFFKIQDMDVKRPQSFYFHFARALALAGDKDNARKAAKLYLKNPKNLKYRSQAQTYL